MRWPARLGDLVFLGTPHHGAPLERARPLGRPAARRHARTPRRSRAWARCAAPASPTCATATCSTRTGTGATASRAAPTARQPVPLPAGVRCYAAGGQLGDAAGDLKERLLGDGLVPLDSALGRHRRPARAPGFADAPAVGRLRHEPPGPAEPRRGLRAAARLAGRRLLKPAQAGISRPSARHALQRTLEQRARRAGDAAAGGGAARHRPGCAWCTRRCSVRIRRAASRSRPDGAGIRRPREDGSSASAASASSLKRRGSTIGNDGAAAATAAAAPHPAAPPVRGRRPARGAPQAPARARHRPPPRRRRRTARAGCRLPDGRAAPARARSSPAAARTAARSRAVALPPAAAACSRSSCTACARTPTVAQLVRGRAAHHDQPRQCRIGRGRRPPRPPPAPAGPTGPASRWCRWRGRGR